MVRMYKIIDGERILLGVLEMCPFDEMEAKMMELDAEFSIENDYVFEKAEADDSAEK